MRGAGVRVEREMVFFFITSLSSLATLCAWPVLYKRWMHSSSPAPHSRTILNLLPPFQSTSRSPTTRKYFPFNHARRSGRHRRRPRG